VTNYTLTKIFFFNLYFDETNLSLINKNWFLHKKIIEICRIIFRGGHGGPPLNIIRLIKMLFFHTKKFIIFLGGAPPIRYKKKKNKKINITRYEQIAKLPNDCQKYLDL